MSMRLSNVEIFLLNPLIELSDDVILSLFPFFFPLHQNVADVALKEKSILSYSVVRQCVTFAEPAYFSGSLLFPR